MCEAWVVYIVCLTERPVCVRLGLFILFALQRGLCVLGLGCLYCMPYREAWVKGMRIILYDDDDHDNT